jgi:hypothetical protein
MTKNAAKTRVLWLAIAAVFTIMLLQSCGGDDPVQPGQPPDITVLTAAPSDIVPGDSSRITYKSVRADSLKLSPNGARLTPTDSGSLWVKPAHPTLYAIKAYNRDGRDSAAVYVSMSTVVPSFTSFVLSEDTIVSGDSAILTWEVVRADSVVFDHGLGTVTGQDSGQTVLHATDTITYRAIAYNDIGTDTGLAAIAVQYPHQILAPNGLYYKGAMGSATQTPAMRFRPVDSRDNVTTKAWMHFRQIDGDGEITIDSAQVDATGSARAGFRFNGSRGDAVIQATIRAVDSIQVQVRASTIITGDSGQGQYILLDDHYADVRHFNGQPASVDEDPAVWINYANYEAALGVVVMIIDVDSSGTATDNEPVYGVILNTVYTGKSADSLGVGSTIQAFQAVYGSPDTTYVDLNPPVANVYVFR